MIVSVNFADRFRSPSAIQALWPDIVGFIPGNDHTNALLQIARRLLRVALL